MSKPCKKICAQDENVILLLEDVLNEVEKLGNHLLKNQSPHKNQSLYKK